MIVKIGEPIVLSSEESKGFLELNNYRVQVDKLVGRKIIKGEKIACECDGSESSISTYEDGEVAFTVSKFDVKDVE